MAKTTKKEQATKVGIDEITDAAWTILNEMFKAPLKALDEGLYSFEQIYGDGDGAVNVDQTLDSMAKALAERVDFPYIDEEQLAKDKLRPLVQFFVPMINRRLESGKRLAGAGVPLEPTKAKEGE